MISNSALTPRHSDSSVAPVSFDRCVDHLPRAGRLESRSKELGPALGGSGASEGGFCPPTRPPYGAPAGPRDRKRLLLALSPVKRRRQFSQRRARGEAIRRDIWRLFTWKLAEHLMARGLSQNLAAIRLGVSPSTLCRVRHVFDQGGYSAIVPCLREALPGAVEWDFGEWMEL